MNKSLILGALMLMLFLPSCSTDCELTTLEDIIIGSWEISALGQTSGEVEFLADGTLIDPDDAFISGEINGTILDEKTYEVISDILINARAASGSSFLEFELDVSSFECDKIVIDIFGIDVNMKRI